MVDSIGDLSVDVSADTTTLETRLKAKLEEMSRRIQAKIQVALDTAAATVSMDVFRKIGSRALEVPVMVQTLAADLELDAWIQAQSAKAITLGVDFGKGQLAGIGNRLKAITGLTAISGEMSKFGGMLDGFFAAIPLVAQLTLMFTNLMSVGLDAIGSIAVTLSTVLNPALAGTAAVGLALPGLFLAMKVGISIFKDAFSKVSPYMKELKADYKDLKIQIGENFWATAQGPFEEFFSNLKKAGTSGIFGLAQTLGATFGSLLTNLTNALGSGGLNKIFGNMQAGLAAIQPAMAPLAQIMVNLAYWGTSLLKPIAEWLTKIAYQFNAWLSNALATGKLTQDLQGLWGVIHLLETGVDGLLGIFHSIATAAKAANIGDFLTPLQRISDIMNGPVFQQGLTIFFQGAKQGATGLFSALIPIGNMLGTLAPIIANFMAGAGQTIGTLFSSLADALSGPVFQKGLGEFFQGILSFVQPLIPLMPIFAEKLALIAGLGGKVLTELGPVFGTLLTTMVPVLATLVAAVGPLVQVMGPALSSVIKALGPLFVALFTALGPILQVIAALLPMVSLLATYMTNNIGWLLPMIAGIATFAKILSVVTGVITALNVVLGILGVAELTVTWPVVLIIAAIAALVAIIILVATHWKEVTTFIQQAWANIGKFFKTIGDDIAKWWTGFWDGIFTFAKKLFDAYIGIYVGVFKFLWSGITAIFTAVSDWWKGFWKGFVDVVMFILKPWITMFTALWNGVSWIMNAVWTLIVSLVTIAIYTVRDVIMVAVNAISAWWNPIWQNISDFFTTIWNALVLGIQMGLKVVSDVWSTVWNGISSVFMSIWNFLVGLATSEIKAVESVITTVVNAISATWNFVWGGISSFFSGLWKGFVAIVTVPLQAVEKFIGDTINNISKTWGLVWGGLGDVVKNIWSGITGFVKGGINGIIDLINGLVNGINSVAGVASKLSGGAVNLHVDKLPHLADGATVLPRPGGTIALLGEAGRAESVVDTGKFNSLMDMVLNTFPKALNAVAGASVGGSGNGATAVGGPGTVVHNENHFPVPAGVDPAAIAQEYVNRAAEKVGLGAAA